MIDHTALAELLHAIGWNSPCDAQWERLKDAIPQIREIVAAPVEQAQPAPVEPQAQEPVAWMTEIDAYRKSNAFAHVAPCHQQGALLGFEHACAAVRNSTAEDRKKWQSLDFDYNDKDRIRTFHATAFDAGLAVAQRRDREADRSRFPDPLFNKWLDESISDAGHTVWDQIGDTAAAWAGWDNRPNYAKPVSAVNVPELPLHFMEGVENGGYYLASDVHRALALSAAPSAPIQANSDDAKDAARWRALLNVARIRPLGSAGLEKPETGNYAHLGLELWTVFGRDYSPELLDTLDRENSLGREWLTKFADIAATVQQKEGEAC